MKKFIAFLMAVGVVAFLLPMQGAEARGGRGGGRGLSGGSKMKPGRRRDKDAQKLKERGELTDRRDLLNDRSKERTRERRGPSS